MERNWVRESRSITFSIGRENSWDPLPKRRRRVSNSECPGSPGPSSSSSFLSCTDGDLRLITRMCMWVSETNRHLLVHSPYRSCRLIGSKHGKAWLYYADKGRPTKSTERIHSFFILRATIRQMTTTGPVIEREPGSFDRRLNDRRRALSLSSAGYCLFRTGSGTIWIRSMYILFGRGQKIKKSSILFRIEPCKKGKALIKERKKKEIRNSNYSNCDCRTTSCKDED